MNYGKFFRLNRSLSKIEEGIAIYDYVDLPAYFTPSVENYLSPKYPISVNISQSSVSFRLHYCAFKIEGQKENFENYTYYTYDSDDFKRENKDKYKSGDDIKVAHMEEVILDLPFIENATSILSDIIKDIYITNFPQMIGGNTSTGGRFLEQLIHKRYPKSSEWKSIKELENDGDTEALLYGTLREASDNSPSYSTLWLMDLFKDVEGEKDKKRIDLYNKKDGSVVAFLRKLLLDFMFDLKHSDIFQNSANYHQMYSGLMSDFFFSALMHKCEYYYYRKLTRQAVDAIEKEEVDKEKRKKAITTLYASEFVKAEDLWIKDIMNPLAEKEFEHRYPGSHTILYDLFEYYNFKQWPSWFADPEEEMRRICFSMDDSSGERHICNSDTLVEFLGLEKQNDFISRKMVSSRDNNREVISRWFLKRYDFNDVVHLHFFKHLNLILLFSCIIFLSCLFRINIIVHALYKIEQNIIPCLLCLSYFLSPFLGGLFLKYASEKKWTNLAKRRLILTIKRTATLFLFFGGPVIAYLGVVNDKDDIFTYIIVCALVVIVAYLLLIKYLKLFPNFRPISRLHLILPRLVAAISFAWITLSMGFDLYVSFFDSYPNWYTISLITVIVFVFIMYEVNRITPKCTPLRKMFRSFELLVISYMISLAVGLVVVNFVGEKFMERGDYLTTYYEENLTKDYIINSKKTIPDSLRPERTNIQKTAKLTDVKHIRVPNDTTYDTTQIAYKIPIINNDNNSDNQIHIFVLHDFLIMFAFIAMFMGIFIQLIIFGDNKQMTEL